MVEIKEARSRSGKAVPRGLQSTRIGFFLREGKERKGKEIVREMERRSKGKRN